MPDPSETAALHEEGWRTHDAREEWEDSTNSGKKAQSLISLRTLGDPASVRLLDFGCGNGFLTNFFHSQGYAVEGIDVSKTIIESNRKRFPEVPFHIVPSERETPYPDGAFDAVFCSEVIEHVYNVDGIFREFPRLLRPGGILILTTPYHGIVKNVLTALFFFERHFDPTWQHIRFWTKKSLTRVCREHGLRPIRWSHLGRFWPVPKTFFVVCRKDET